MNTRQLGPALFALAFVLFASYASTEFWNPQVVSRLALSVGIVEDQTLVIDRFAARTIDKAFLEGHYYSDKVPGLSFLALPAVAMVNAILGAFSETNQGSYIQAAEWTTSGLLGALAVSLVFDLACRLGATPRQGVVAAFVLAMATPYFGWSTVFFAHASSGALLIVAATMVAFAFTAASAWPPWRLGLGVGLLLGLTVVVDVVAAPATAILGLLTLWLASRQGRRYAAATGALLVADGLVGVSPLLIYNQLAFGSPFVMGYSNVVGFAGMKAGFFGLTAFSPSRAMALLVGPYRGLLVFAPVLALTPIGLWRMFRAGGPRRPASMVVVAVFLALLGVNASYTYWDGGWSTGPRHIVPALPFLAVAMAFAWPRSESGRLLARLLLGASLVISLASVVVTMYASDQIAQPLTELILPRALVPEGFERAFSGMLGWAAFGLLWYFADTAKHPDRQQQGPPVRTSGPRKS